MWRALLCCAVACSSTAPSSQPQPQAQPTESPPTVSPAQAAVMDAATSDAPDMFPDVTFQTLGGFTRDRSSFAGSPAVIVFLAVEDPASKAELAMLGPVSSRYEKTVTFFGVIDQRDGTKLDIRDLLEGNKVPFSVGTQTAAIADAFKRPANAPPTPTTFVFDRHGKRVAHNIGPFDAAKLTALLDSLLR